MAFKVTRRSALAGLSATGAAFLLQSRASAQADVVRIGAPLPLTGPLSPEGTKLRQGYDLWAETVNAKGGLAVGKDRRKVEIVYADYQSNTPRAVQLVDRLVTQDKVSFLFSPFGSGATKAASAVSERYGIPTIAPTASSVEVFDQKPKFLFGLFTPNDSLTNPIADLVKATAPDVKRIAILARNDLFPLALGEEAAKSATTREFSVVFNEKYTIGTLDHSSAISQMKAAAPDWVFATGYTNDMILLRKQMADLSLNPRIVTMIIGPAYREFVEATGALSEGILSAAWWHQAARYKGTDIFGSSDEFARAFQARFNIEPDYTGAVGAAAGAVLQLAIEKAGSIDGKAVREALASNRFETFFGPIRFGGSGQVDSYVPPVFQIQSGKPTVVYPSDIRQANFKLAAK